MDFSLLSNKFISSKNRIFFKNIVGNYLIKVLALLISLLITPAYINYFYSQSVLGVWFTAISVINWIMLFDLGIGGGLRNQLVKALELDNKQKIKKLITSAYFLVLVIVVVLLLVTVIFIRLVNWNIFFGISEAQISSNTLTQILFILIIGVIFRFFSVLVSHILYSLQRAIWPSLLIVISNVLILMYLFLVKPNMDENDIINLALVNSIANNLPAFIATIVVFMKPLKGLHPEFKLLRISYLKMILGVGSNIFYIQILFILIYGIKELFISWFINPIYVVEYQIYFKLIGTISTLFVIALNPVWSAVTKAHILNDYPWINKLYKNGKITIIVFSLIQVILILLMPLLLRFWLGDNTIQYSYFKGIIFAFYNTLYMWIMLNYNFSLGIGQERYVLKHLVFVFLLNTMLSWFFTTIFPEWIFLLIATIISSISFSVFIPAKIHTILKVKKQKPI